MGREYQERLRQIDLLELVYKSAELFLPQAKALIEKLELPKVPYSNIDIIDLWDDVKTSVGFTEEPPVEAVYGKAKIFNWEKAVVWGDEIKEGNTHRLVGKFSKDCYRIYPISLTSYLQRWYSTYKVAVIDYPIVKPGTNYDLP